jgi:ABC-2 type transport system permease protein
VIATLIAMSARHLARDRSALLLSFVLPLAFFSVSALAFRGIGSRGSGPLPIAVFDLAGSSSGPFLTRLAADPTVTFRLDPAADCADEACALRRGTQAIESGGAAGALLLGSITTDPALPITLLVAEGDELAARALGRAVAEAVSGRMPTREGFALRSVARAPSASDLGVRGALAGLLVVFLLFTATGASGWLIEEENQGTFSLLLTTRAGVGRILGAQWLFLVLLGALQGALMMAWATLAFGLRWGSAAQLVTVSIVVVATTAATSAFGLLLASLVRTRAQLAAASTIAILLLSALGGSFVPQAALPETLRTAGLLNPTTWAVSGLWQALDTGQAATSILPNTAALCGFTALFLTVATASARRRVVT